MDFLPIFVNIKKRNCLVVGGGEVAARKIALLLRAGAHITIIAPELCAELSEQLREQLSQGMITHRVEAFRPDHLGDAVLVIAATSDRAVNREVSEAAGQLRIPVNVVDNPALCSFIMPSIVDRSPVLV
ncbi:MAG: precorrin-2 dehydrogenase/sirohydrochlorin ferrochelatase family protein, partial [Nitrosospira sp.]